MSDFILKIQSFAQDNSLFNCSDIVVGLSGGPDSVALLYALNSIKETTGDTFPKLSAVHVNHGLRGVDADNDEEFCVSLCKNLGVELKVFHFDVLSLAKENHRSFEEMGRIKRYECFDEVCKQYDNPRIALAHHKDDVAETMLMNLFRGSGLEGLTSPRALNGNLIRPLLPVTKEEIISFLDSNLFSYCIDETNFESDTTRNKWRNEIIPLISDVSVKKPSSALMDVYDLLSSDLQLIESIVDTKYKELLVTKEDSLFLDAKEFDTIPYAVKSRLIRRLWLDTFSNLTDFNKVHVDSVLEFVSSKVSGTGTLDMPFARKAVKNNGVISFCEEGEELKVALSYAKYLGYLVLDEDINIKIEVNKTTNLPNTDINIKSIIVENSVGLEYNNLSWYFPYEGDLSDLVVSLRTNLTSNAFTKAGSGISKSIGKVLSDNHVPKISRNLVAGFFVNDELVWIPGLGHARGFLSSASYDAWNKTNPDFEGSFLRVEIIERGI